MLQIRSKQFLQVTNFSVWNLQEYFRQRDLMIQLNFELLLEQMISIEINKPVETWRDFLSKYVYREKNHFFKLIKSKVAKRNNLASKNFKDSILIQPFFKMILHSKYMVLQHQLLILVEIFLM